MPTPRSTPTSISTAISTSVPTPSTVRRASERRDAPPAGVVAVHRIDLAVAALGRRLTEAMVRSGASGFTENHDVQILLTLLLDGPTTPGTLTSVTAMTTGGMTALLDRIERSGLVLRTRVPENPDRRSVTIVLTAEGTRTAELIADASRAALTDGCPEVDEMVVLLGLTHPRRPRPLDRESTARLLLTLADRSLKHNREVEEAAVAAGIGGLDVLPGRRTYNLCCLIDAQGPRSPGEIAAHVERSRTAATLTVQALEGAGLIRRVPADPPRRGRAYDVDLTAKGRRLARLISAPTPAIRASGEALAVSVPASRTLTARSTTAARTGR